MPPPPPPKQGKSALGTRLLPNPTLGEKVTKLQHMDWWIYNGYRTK